MQKSFESRVFCKRITPHTHICKLIFYLLKKSILNIISSIQMELIDLKKNSLLKIKLLMSFLRSHVILALINFWPSFLCEHFPELRKYARSSFCRFGSTCRCKQAFTSKKLIKKINWGHDWLIQIWKNSLLPSVTNLGLNITSYTKSKQTKGNLSEVTLNLCLYK